MRSLGAPSGFLLTATLREHFKRTDLEGIHQFGECLYYDDFLKSFPNEFEAIIDALQSSLSNASMRLAKWKTKSPAAADHLLLSGVQSPALSLTGGNILKVLGISWSPAGLRSRRRSGVSSCHGPTRLQGGVFRPTAFTFLAARRSPRTLARHISSTATQTVLPYPTS